MILETFSQELIWVQSQEPPKPEVVWQCSLLLLLSSSCCPAASTDLREFLVRSGNQASRFCSNTNQVLELRASPYNTELHRPLRPSELLHSVPTSPNLPDLVIRGRGSDLASVSPATHLYQNHNLCWGPPQGSNVTHDRVLNYVQFKTCSYNWPYIGARQPGMLPGVLHNLLFRLPYRSRRLEITTGDML